MSADKQYVDALKAIEYIEASLLPAAKLTTYGVVCEALAY